MIKAVSVTNYLGETIELELAFPEKSGFAILGIEGLGPGKATINTTEASTNDGSLYNSARVNSRNIVIYLKFLENPDIETTRQLSYKYFPIKKQVKLLIEEDNRISEVTGYVESNEPTIFSSSEATQISILCPDPYFYSKDKTTTIFSGVEPMFEFPFSNESLTEKLLTFGDIQSNSEKSVIYEGDAEVGIVITVTAIGPAKNLTIYNLTTRTVMKINSSRLVTLTGKDISTGDEIIISTIKGDKYIKLLRNGVYINILNCLEKDVSWFQLSKGGNLFSYTAEEGMLNLQFKIENSIVYEGV